MQRVWAVLVLWVMVSSILYAQDTTKAVYRIGMAKMAGLPDLGSSWQTQVQNKFRSDVQHTLADEEKEQYKLFWQKRQEQDLAIQISKLYRDNDQLELVYQSSLSKQRDIQEKIKKLKRDLDKAARAELPQELPDKLPIEWVSYDELEFDPHYAYAYADVYLWLYGQIREVKDGVYLIEYLCYQSLTGVTQTIIKQTVLEKDIPTTITLVADALREIIIGREWAAVVIQSNNSQSRYRVDNEPVLNMNDLTLLSPGQHKITVITPGYSKEEQLVDLPAYRYTKVKVVPIANPELVYTINSDPQGAAVFLEGEYMGTTPLSINAGKGQGGVLTLDGYQTSFFSITNKKEMMIHLYDNNFDATAHKASAKTLFYTSFGCFVGSLIVPIVTSGLRRDYLEKAAVYQNYNDTTNANIALQTARNYSYATWGSLGVSGGLLGWTIYQLVEYVRASSAGI